MSDVIEITVEALDEVFGRGYAQKNPSLIGMVMIHDAIVGLTNSFTVTGQMGGEYHSIDNIAQALYAVKSAIFDLSQTMSCIDINTTDPATSAVADALENIATNLDRGKD
jgi:hypothetical protein